MLYKYLRWIIDRVWLWRVVDQDQHGIAAAFWQFSKLLKTIDGNAGSRVS